MSLDNFVKSILAGVSISIGGIVYLSVTPAVVGGLLFSVGLLTIYFFNWNLYTGKCCFVVDNPKANSPITLNALIGNLVGTAAVGYAMRLTSLSIVEKVNSVVSGKLSNSLLECFVLAIFCGIMMSIAVLGYKKQTSDFGRSIAIVLPITVFIVAKFEHSIANMFYISLANCWNLETTLFIAICAVGNLVGCSIIPLGNMISSKLAK